MARVPYRSQDDLSPEYRDLIVSTLQPGKAVNVYAAIGNNPVVLKGLRTFFGVLWTDSGLSERQRELVILAVASETEVEYEWHQHVNIATSIGLNVDEIASIAEKDDGVFPPDEQALLGYARAVVRGAVTDEEFERLADHFGEDTMVGATCVAGGYQFLGCVIQALGVEIEEGDNFVGWTPEK